MARELFDKIVKIKYQLGEQPLGATGFFYRRDDEVYLVTSEHVVQHEFGVSPARIRVSLRSSNNQSNVEPVYVELFEGIEADAEVIVTSEREKRWLIHPEYTSADLAVIPLDFDFGAYANTAFHEGWLVTSDEDVEVGRENTVIQHLGGDAIVAGFPGRLFHSPGSHSPIIRNGLISSQYGPFYHDEPYFVLDSVMHKGMSGSPVFLKPGARYWSPEIRDLVYWNPEEEDFDFAGAMLGVHSGPIPFEPQSEHGQVKTENLQLNSIWYGELINEIIDSH